MAPYKSEVLHHAYRGRLRPRSHYALGWLPAWTRLAAVAPGLANLILRNGATASLVRRLGGIDSRRPLPPLARHPPPPARLRRPGAARAPLPARPPPAPRAPPGWGG